MKRGRLPARTGNIRWSGHTNSTGRLFLPTVGAIFYLEQAVSLKPQASQKHTGRPGQRKEL